MKRWTRRDLFGAVLGCVICRRPMCDAYTATFRVAGRPRAAMFVGEDGFESGHAVRAVILQRKIMAHVYIPPELL